jgi:hypothetical protein
VRTEGVPTTAPCRLLRQISRPSPKPPRRCGRPLATTNAPEHGINEDEGTGRFGKSECKVNGDRSNPRLSDDVSPINSQVFKERFKVVGLGVALIRGRYRPTRAPHVVAHDLIMLGEGSNLVVPHAGVEGESVDEYKGCPDPAIL